jgi:spore maturation protein CgeB
MSLLLKKAKWFHDRRGKLVVFIGNEYNLLSDKIGFLKSIKADYICTQLPFEAARWLYQDCVDSEILPLPHALNPNIYFPKPHSVRKIDLGFIGVFYDHLIGDIERTSLIHFFRDHGEKYELTCDVQSQRLPRLAWAEYLRSCKGILGAESGTYYLDRTGERIEAARDYVRSHRGATFVEVHQLFFAEASRQISGKAISSRHFEPIGTKTCQILIEGNYNGILKADEHYISVKKDLSNVGEAIRQFKDEAYRSSMVNQTYDYILSTHTYKHRVDFLLRTVLKNLPTV